MAKSRQRSDRLVRLVEDVVVGLRCRQARSQPGLRPRPCGHSDPPPRRILHASCTLHTRSNAAPRRSPRLAKRVSSRPMPRHAWRQLLPRGVATGPASTARRALRAAARAAGRSARTRRRPEELALEEWQLHSIAGIPATPGRSPHLKFCLRVAASPSPTRRAFPRARAPAPASATTAASLPPPSRASRALLWGAAPPTPPSRTSTLRGSAHPPALGFSSCGGYAPTPPSGARTSDPRTDPAPSPGERGGEGARPQMVVPRWVVAPVAPPPGALPRTQPPRADPAPSPLAGERGGEGVRRPPRNERTRAPQSIEAAVRPGAPGFRRPPE